MACAEAVERLWDLLDDQLGAGDRAALDQHLAWCVRCCGELAFARDLREMLRERSSVPLPAGVQARLEGFIDTLIEPTGEAGH